MIKKAYLPCPSELEATPCPACGKCDERVLLNFDSFGFPIRTVECVYCGLIYANPRPTEEFLRHFYETKYLYFYEGARRIDDCYVNLKGLPKLAERRVARYSRYFFPGVRVLDIGSGTGLFLAEILKNCPGASVLGVEPDPVSSGYAENALGLRVHHGFLDSLPVGVPFDIVTSFHVIEHVHSLHDFMGNVRKHLRPCGYFIAETPNSVGSWTGVGMFHIAHLQTFSPRTLANILRVYGFQVVEAEPLEDDLDISNLSAVGKMTETNFLDGALQLRDLAESARLAEKCNSLRLRRSMRVLRTWVKWMYFALGGTNGR
jgi:2-polyprenyl-3-methyl-5-hydroxy-6-metoxy-1,4-benzoquinol methylase